jgi:5-methylcytosine-specific restriction protein A
MRKEFSTKTKALAFQRANGRCEECGFRLTPGKIEYDHRNPDGLTGEPTLSNCVCLCTQCHKDKTRKDVSNIARANRREARHIGAHKSKQPFRGWRRFNGSLVFAKDRT